MIDIFFNRMMGQFLYTLVINYERPLSINQCAFSWASKLVPGSHPSTQI